MDQFIHFAGSQRRAIITHKVAVYSTSRFLCGHKLSIPLVVLKKGTFYLTRVWGGSWRGCLLFSFAFAVNRISGPLHICLVFPVPGLWPLAY